MKWKHKCESTGTELDLSKPVKVWSSAGQWIRADVLCVYKGQVLTRLHQPQLFKLKKGQAQRYKMRYDVQDLEWHLGKTVQGHQFKNITVCDNISFKRRVFIYLASWFAEKVV